MAESECLPEGKDGPEVILMVRWADLLSARIRL